MGSKCPPAFDARSIVWLAWFGLSHPMNHRFMPAPCPRAGGLQACVFTLADEGIAGIGQESPVAVPS